MPDCMLAKTVIVSTSELWAACDLETSFEVSLLYSATHTGSALPVSLPLPLVCHHTAMQMDPAGLQQLRWS